MTSVRENILLRSFETFSRAPLREPVPGAVRESVPGPRIELWRPAGTRTFVDGGWWPHSLDLVTELPPLLAAVEAAGYDRVRRVSYAFAAWNGQPPRTTRLLNRIVKLGSFVSQDAAEISLVDSSGWNRVTVAVVPPDTDPTLARRALAIAGTDGDRHDARGILDIAAHASPAHPGNAGCVDLLAASGWASEGGRVAPP